MHLNFLTIIVLLILVLFFQKAYYILDLEFYNIYNKYIKRITPYVTFFFFLKKKKKTF